MSRRTVLKSEIEINQPLALVWEYICDTDNLCCLCRDALGISLNFEKAPNDALPDFSSRFYAARITPYDVLLSAPGCSYAIRLVETESRTQVISAVSFDEAAAEQPLRSDIQFFLQALKTRSEQAGRLMAVSPEDFDTRIFDPALLKTGTRQSSTESSSQDITGELIPAMPSSTDGSGSQLPSDELTGKILDHSDIFTEPESTQTDPSPDLATGQYSAPDTAPSAVATTPALQPMPQQPMPQQSIPQQPVYQPAPQGTAVAPGYPAYNPAMIQQPVFNQPQAVGKHKPKRKRLRKRAIAAIAGFCLIIILSVLLLTVLSPSFGNTKDTPVVLDSLDLDSISGISPGMEIEKIQELLNSDGQVFKEDSSALLFQGGSLTGNGLYSVQLLIHHVDDKVVDLTYLDLSAENNIVLRGNLQLSPDMDTETLINTVGNRLSMLRIYNDGEDLINEYHFGTADPFANFNSAWRGEYVFIINRTTDVLTARQWPAFNRYDPLLVQDITDTALSSQYSSYTDYVNDLYMTNKAMCMLEKYSIGDAIRTFGDMTLYDNQTGINLYTLESPVMITGTDQPLYVICYGFDSTGVFLLSTFTNMRLFDHPDSLEKSNYSSVTRGMNYNEVRKLVGVLPTAVFVDQKYYTLCFGSYTGRNSFDEQFQFMVKFDIKTDYINTIWNNTGS